MDDELNYTWEDSVENFFKWAEEWCGMAKGSYEIELLHCTVRTNDDLDRFVSSYDGDMFNLLRTAYKLMG